MADHPFVHKLKMAQAYTGAAIKYLNEALATRQSRLLNRKDRHLLLTTRTNLSRYDAILRSLVPTAIETMAAYPTLPGFTLSELQAEQMPPQSPSPDKCPPARSE